MPGIQVKRSIYKNTPKTYNITHSLARKYTKTKIMVSFLQFKVSEIKEKPKMLVCSFKCCQTSTPQNEVNCEKTATVLNLSDLIYPILVTREDMLLVDAWNKYFSYLCLVWEYLEVKQHQQLVKRSFLADRAFSGWSGSAAAAGGDLWRCEDALVAAELLGVCTGRLPRILISHNAPPPIRSHPQAPSSLTAPIHGLIVPQHPACCHYLILTATEGLSTTPPHLCGVVYNSFPNAHLHSLIQSLSLPTSWEKRQGLRTKTGEQSNQLAFRANLSDGRLVGSLPELAANWGSWVAPASTPHSLIQCDRCARSQLMSAPELANLAILDSTSDWLKLFALSFSCCLLGLDQYQPFH